MILLYEDDYPEWVSKEIECKLFSVLDIPMVEDIEIWSIIKEYEDIPHLGNVYSDLVLSRLIGYIGNTYTTIDTSKLTYSVNGMCTYLYIDDEVFDTCSDIIKKLGEMDEMDYECE